MPWARKAQQQLYRRVISSLSLKLLFCNYQFIE